MHVLLGMSDVACGVGALGISGSCACTRLSASTCRPPLLQYSGLWLLQSPMSPMTIGSDFPIRLLSGPAGAGQFLFLGSDAQDKQNLRVLRSCTLLRHSTAS
jgi:hypothetical protein